MARGVKQLGPFTQTVRVQYSTPEERFVRDWDAKAGAEQKMVRVAERARMRQKKTPIGAGTLKPPM